MSALGEATRLFATSGNVAGRLERSTGPRRRGAAASGAGARLPRRRARRVRPLRQPARPGQAHRPADRGGRARAVAPGRRRRRGAGRRPAARSWPTTRGARRPGPLRGAGRPATSWRDLYATCFASYYAPVDEDFGLGPYESFLSGKPVITATDAGGPLDVVHDGSTGRVVAPEPAADRPRRRSGCASIPDEAVAFGRAGKAIAERGHVGRGDRAAAVVKVAIFSPMPPERSGIADYSALLLPALRERVRGRRRRSGGRRSRRAGPISASTTSATTRTRTAGSSMRCDARPGSSSSTTSCSTTSSSGITLGTRRRAGVPRRARAGRGCRRRGCSGTP